MTNIENYIKPPASSLFKYTKPGIELILDSVFNIAYAPKLNTTVTFKVFSIICPIHIDILAILTNVPEISKRI